MSAGSPALFSFAFTAASDVLIAAHFAIALRGVTFGWREQSGSAGEFTVTYPEPVPAAYGAFWRGTLQFVYSLTRVTGATGPVALDAQHTVLRFPVSWR